MGWTSCSYWASKADAVKEVTSASHWGENFNTLKTSTKGKCFWVLAEYKQGEKQGMKFIALFVIEKSEGEWMYKDMDESCGPCYYNCPLLFIAIAKESNDEPGGYAKTWREKVIKFHKDAKINKDIKSKLVAGAKIKLYDVLYELLHKLDGRKGWSVLSLKDNIQYRMTAKQVNQSAVVG